MDYLIISDIPTPWREPVFERVYRKLAGAVQVVYFKDNEKRRLWTFRMGSHPKTILKAITLTTGGTERFFNPGLVPFLLRRRPRVALIFASIKDPSGWLAMGLCRMLGTKVALLDDSWLGRDRVSTVCNVGQACGIQPVWRCLCGYEPPDIGDVQTLQQPNYGRAVFSQPPGGGQRLFREPAFRPDVGTAFRCDVFRPHRGGEESRLLCRSVRGHQRQTGKMPRACYR